MDEMATMIDAGLELAADFLSKHRPHSGGTPAPAPTCINAFSLTSLPDLLAANLDPQKMKAGLRALADLIGGLMSVDWSATTENMPACDTSQPLSRCADFTTSSACYGAFGAGEPTRDDFFDCMFHSFMDENYNSIITQDGETLGACVAATDGSYDSYDVHYQCTSECDDIMYGFQYGYNVNHTAVIDCFAACDTDYTLCTHQTPTHAEVIDRDVSDAINHEVLAPVRDFLMHIVSALPDSETRPPVSMQSLSLSLSLSLSRLESVRASSWSHQAMFLLAVDVLCCSCAVHIGWTSAKHSHGLFRVAREFRRSSEVVGRGRAGRRHPRSARRRGPGAHVYEHLP